MAARTESMTMDRLASPGAAHARRLDGGRPSRWAQAGTFLRHFLEMVASMMVGMLPLGLIYMSLSPAFPILRAPAVGALAMAIFMAVPMAAWMRHRGHTWRQVAEMTAAMLAPGVPLVAVGKWGPAHIAMILGMLALMLYRRDEYLHGRCHDPSEIGDGHA